MMCSTTLSPEFRESLPQEYITLKGTTGDSYGSRAWRRQNLCVPCQLHDHRIPLAIYIHRMTLGNHVGFRSYGTESVFSVNVQVKLKTLIILEKIISSEPQNRTKQI